MDTSGGSGENGREAEIWAGPEGTSPEQEAAWQLWGSAHDG